MTRIMNNRNRNVKHKNKLFSHTESRVSSYWSEVVTVIAWTKQNTMQRAMRSLRVVTISFKKWLDRTRLSVSKLLLVTCISTYRKDIIFIICFYYSSRVCSPGFIFFWSTLNKVEINHLDVSKSVMVTFLLNFTIYEGNYIPSSD